VAKRILVLSEIAPGIEPFRKAAEKLSLELVLGCEDSFGSLQLDFKSRDSALAVVDFAQQTPFAAIIAVGDKTGSVAARAASMLGLPFHTPRAADLCRNKAALRTKLETLGLATADAHDSATSTELLLTLHVLMNGGRARVIAAVCNTTLAPSSLPSNLQEQISDGLRRVIPAVGLKHGPVRLDIIGSEDALTVLDLSMCVIPDRRNALLRFHIPLVDENVSFEELIIRNALDLDTTRAYLDLTPAKS
jgi:hypothetical protein